MYIPSKFALIPRKNIKKNIFNKYTIENNTKKNCIFWSLSKKFNLSYKKLKKSFDFLYWVDCN